MLCISWGVLSVANNISISTNGKLDGTTVMINGVTITNIESLYLTLGEYYNSLEVVMEEEGLGGLRKSVRYSMRLDPEETEAKLKAVSSQVKAKIVLENGKYCVKSEDGSKDLGCYDTKDEAVKRLAQIEYYKKNNK